MKRRTGTFIRTGVLAGSLLLIGDAAVSFHAGSDISHQGSVMDKQGENLQRRIDATPILAEIRDLRMEAIDTYGDAADLHHAAANKFGRSAGDAGAATLLLTGLGLSFITRAPETPVETITPIVA